MKLPKIDPPGWLLAIAMLFVLAGMGIVYAREPVTPKKLAAMKWNESVEIFGWLNNQPEATYCRSMGGRPLGVGLRFCDFGACRPCPRQDERCGVRTIVCPMPEAGECNWGGEKWTR